MSGLSATLALMLALSLPAGWRRPANEEVDQDWRAKDAKRFLAIDGDFDGDAKKDSAEIVVAADGKSFAIVVDVSSAAQAVILEKGDIGSLARMGIALVKPGRYKTACGKGYWACGVGEPEVLVLKKEAIDFFAEGSADVILYWDPQKKQFNRIQMSD
jgi:hypothetical protein